MLYLIIGIVVFYVIYFFISVFNSHQKLHKLYTKYMNIANNKNLLGKEIAFLGKRVFGLQVKVAMRDGVLTDAYSVKKKIIIMSEEVCNNSSIASAGIVAHELGHAVQHKNKSLLFVICTFLNKFNRIFCGFALPCILVGGVMWLVDWNMDIGKIILFVGICLLFVNILKNLLDIPLESNASEIGFRFLVDNDIIDKRDYRKVKRLMGVAAKTYMANFFKQLFPFIK